MNNSIIMIIASIKRIIMDWLPVFSFVIAFISLYIACESRKRMTALTNLNYDEKLAIMADHLINLEQGFQVEFFERIKSDLSAVYNLQNYADNNKKEDLIEKYVIRIGEKILSNGRLTEQQTDALKEFFDIALKYNIANDKIENLKQKL